MYCTCQTTACEPMNPLGSHQSKVLYILALMRILSYSFSSFAILLCRIPKVRASFSSFTVILQSREFVLYCFYDSSEAENHLLRKKNKKQLFWYFSKTKSLFLTSNVISHQRSFFQSDETWMLVNLPTLQPSAQQQKSLYGDQVKTAALHFEQY